MRYFLYISIVAVTFVSPLSGGDAANYVGLTTTEKWIYEEVVIDSSFGYPFWTVTYDSIPYDSVIISNFFYLDGKEAYERYSFKRHSDGSTEVDRDTLYENGNEIWLKYTIYADTAIRAYVTPINVGDSWDMGIGGMFIDDFDNDGTVDTMIVSNDTAYVLSLGSFTVPAGTYDAYELYRTGRVELRASSQPLTIEWVFSYERFVPELGIIYDSTVIVDSVGGFETHWKFDINRLLSTVGVSEKYDTPRKLSSKTIFVNSPTLRIKGMINAALYGIDGTVIAKSIDEEIVLPRKGVFILRGMDGGQRYTTIKVIYR